MGWPSHVSVHVKLGSPRKTTPTILCANPYKTCVSLQKGSKRPKMKTLDFSRSHSPKILKKYKTPWQQPKRRVWGQDHSFESITFAVQLQKQVLATTVNAARNFWGSTNSNALALLKVFDFLQRGNGFTLGSIGCLFLNIWHAFVWGLSTCCWKRLGPHSPVAARKEQGQYIYSTSS